MRGRSLLEQAARPLTGLSAATFAALSRARGARFFHPVGHVFAARLSWNDAAADWLPGALADTTEKEIVVRFSRGLGLPEGVPDFLGLAVKVIDAYAPGRDQDWLFVTSDRDPITRHTLMPSGSFTARAYSTVLPYRWKNGLVTFAAFPAPDSARARTLEDVHRAVATDHVSFELAIAPEGESHIELGELGVMPPPVPEPRVRFNPWNTSPDLRPAGGLNELRRRTYAASQAARPDSGS